MSFSYGIMKNFSKTKAVIHDWDYCWAHVRVNLPDLNVRPVSRVGSIGLRVHTGSVGVCLRLGAQTPQIVANVEQLPVDAVLDALAVQVHSEA